MDLRRFNFLFHGFIGRFYYRCGKHAFEGASKALSFYDEHRTGASISCWKVETRNLGLQAKKSGAG